MLGENGSTRAFEGRPREDFVLFGTPVTQSTKLLRDFDVLPAFWRNLDDIRLHWI